MCQVWPAWELELHTVSAQGIYDLKEHTILRLNHINKHSRLINLIMLLLMYFINYFLKYILTTVFFISITFISIQPDFW